MEKVEQCGRWPQQACTTMFFLIPKCVTSERPIALVHSMIRWWEALRAPEVAKWQQKYRIEWDATEGRSGGAQRTVGDLCELEMCSFRAGEQRSRSGSFGPGLGTNFRTGQSSSYVGLGNAFQIFHEDYACAVLVLRAPEASAVWWLCGGAAPDHHGHSHWIQVELLALTYRVAGCTE